MYYLKHQIKFVGVFVTVFCLLTALALIDTVSADQPGTVATTISHTPTDEELSSVLFSNDIDSNQEYISPEFNTEFEFNGAGLTWIGNAKAKVNFFIRIVDGEWIEVPMMNSEAKDKNETNVSAPIFFQGNTLQYKLVGKDIKQIQNVRLTYFDSTPPPETSTLKSIKTAFNRKLTQSYKLNIISREEWGADESYQTWSPSYTDPQMFIIHHTAGGDSNSDPAAMIRGIYYWHAIVLGWGDIGYNYIIDQQGNVYEGRYGGDGVIGAHTYNDATNTNYNLNSIGIAILGCYEDKTGACGTTSEYSTPIHQAITDLISKKANKFKIKPQGTNLYASTEISNVLGHSDVDQTYCPGSIVHNKLVNVRNTAAIKYQKLVNKKPPYRTELVNSTLPQSYIVGNDTDLSITYKNTGLYKWNPTEVVAQISVMRKNKRKRIEIPEIIYKRAELNISTDLDKLTQKSGDYTALIKLYRKGKVIKGSRVKYVYSVSNPYRAKIIGSSLPIAIKNNWSPTTNITLRNTGEIDWDKKTEIIVNGNTAGYLKKDIPTGEKVTIKIILNPNQDWDIGNKNVEIRLQNNGARIQGSRIKQTIRVD
ncbi:MAG: N-acetylmuramoyl-L-alanine amidase [bacterium]|nr:N-acetylmuramoyl-L-alanine amidase [bacterium]